jgi:hypothetical protein
MKKIPTLFVRDWDGDRRYVLDEITPGCEWVSAGEGVPTRKYDGTCVMFDGEHWWARREVKEGRSEPSGFVALEHDGETGKTVGWEPIGQQSAFAKWHAEALDVDPEGEPIIGPWRVGTYELIGPKVNGDPERYGLHALIFHGYAEVREDAPRDFAGLAAWLHAEPYEGIVWHHEDGRMAKIKKRDFRVIDVGYLSLPADEQGH